DVEPVAQEIGEGTTGEWDAADGPSRLQMLQLCHHAALDQLRHQAMDAAEFEIQSKDEPDPLGILFNDHDLAVLGLVAERSPAADPETLALGGADLVADALRGDLALELGKRQ